MEHYLTIKMILTGLLYFDQAIIGLICGSFMLIYMVFAFIFLFIVLPIKLITIIFIGINYIVKWLKAFFYKAPNTPYKLVKDPNFAKRLGKLMNKIMKKVDFSETILSLSPKTLSQIDNLKRSKHFSWQKIPELKKYFSPIYLDVLNNLCYLAGSKFKFEDKNFIMELDGKGNIIFSIPFKNIKTHRSRPFTNVKALKPFLSGKLTGELYLLFVLSAFPFTTSKKENIYFVYKHKIERFDIFTEVKIDLKQFIPALAEVNPEYFLNLIISEFHYKKKWEPPLMEMKEE